MKRLSLLSLFLGVLCLVPVLSSCDSMIYDDEQNCESGVTLRFIYDYHMEPGANAFPANVDCVEVLVCDAEGHFLSRLEETSEMLIDENYRMDLLLDPGAYHLVVYGGLSCDETKFDFTPDRKNATGRSMHKDDIRVTLPTDENGVSATKLHDIDERTGGFFYGTVDVTITEDDMRGGNYRTVTVNLMKNTNNIQVILQELESPYTIDYQDYNFKIVDDNFYLDGYNNPVQDISRADGVVTGTYLPYHSENRQMGYVDPPNVNGSVVEGDDSNPVQVGCVEFSTSRLFKQNLEKSRLVVTSATETNPDGSEKTIIDIPLITYLTATRGFGSSWIKSDQEYLDRQSNWTMMFFLQQNVWVNARIAVNDWVVRINEAQL